MRKNKIFSFIFVALLALVLVGCTNDKKLPDLANLTESEITAKLDKAKIDYEIQEYFVANSSSRSFKHYGNDLKAGDKLNSGDKIIVYIESPDIALPDLTGQKLDEIKATLAKIGVQDSNVRYRMEIDNTVRPGTFIKYSANSVGDRVDFKERVAIVYDISKEAPDLEGKNIYEIDEIFKELSLLERVIYSFVTDNTKEYNTFASYVDFKPGDSISPFDTIVIDIYTNSDVNIGDRIVNQKELFISKYVDGTQLNQAIELYNPTNSEIDLADYYLAILSNASLTATFNIPLKGKLKPNETFLVVREGARKSLVDKKDLISADLQFDGNDTIQLRKAVNDTYIDTIYQVGNISTTMDEEIFVRKPHITAGNRIFKQIEWASYIPEFDEPVGTHPYEGPKGPGFVKLDNTFQEFGMTKVKLTGVNDGDTVSFESLDPRDTTSYSGDHRIRFLMVDTPETNKPGVIGEPYANVATDFTRTLLNASTETYLQADKSAGLTETYGRTLGLIWFHLDKDVSFSNLAASGNVVVEAGWHLLNYELLKHGLGDRNLAKTTKYRESPIFSNRYLYQWALEGDNYAMENKLGLFSGVDRA